MTEPLALAMLDELRAIRRLLEGQRLTKPSSLKRTDREALSRLLPAISGVMGSELFVVRELFADDSAALRVVLNDQTAKGVGRLLQRAEGQAIEGYAVRGEGSELNVTLWRVVKVDGFPSL